jgi:hypothetical protein
MRRAFRLAFAMQRFELRLLLGAALLLAVIALGLAWQLRVARAEDLACHRAAPPPVEGSRYGDFVLRESAIWGAVAILTLGTTALVVSRRRP